MVTCRSVLRYRYENKSWRLHIHGSLSFSELLVHLCQSARRRISKDSIIHQFIPAFSRKHAIRTSPTPAHFRSHVNIISCKTGSSVIFLFLGLTCGLFLSIYAINTLYEFLTSLMHATTALILSPHSIRTVKIIKLLIAYV